MFPGNREAKTEAQTRVSCTPCLPVVLRSPCPYSRGEQSEPEDTAAIHESLLCARSASNAGVLSPDPHRVPCPSEGVATVLGVGASAMHSVVIIAITIHSFIPYRNEGLPSSRGHGCGCGGQSGGEHRICGSARSEESTLLGVAHFRGETLSCVCKEEGFSRKKRAFPVKGQHMQRQ